MLFFVRLILVLANNPVPRFGDIEAFVAMCCLSGSHFVEPSPRNPANVILQTSTWYRQQWLSDIYRLVASGASYLLLAIAGICGAFASLQVLCFELYKEMKENKMTQKGRKSFLAA